MDEPRLGEDEEQVAGGGLLHRRSLLRGGVLAGGLGAAFGARAADAIGAGSPPGMTRPGVPFTPYGVPSHWREDIKRSPASPPNARGTGASRTPLERLEGTITPAGLHFERHHNGVPEIDPAAHTLTLHGLVRQPLVFTLDTLMRYPMHSRAAFVECAGNSGGMIAPSPAQASAGVLHGLVSGSEWTGVLLSLLLDEAGVDPAGRWLLAEGGDAAGMSRSVPLWKAMQDAMVVLYQNGEPIRPEQGFPMRLLLPGFQGNMNVKWLRRLKVTAGPTFTKDETSRYTELMPGGKARQFMFEMGVKSVITRPSFGLSLSGPGLYEISGLAWSGAGKVAKVEVSADGGKSWAPAALNDPVQSKALTRFRAPWRWAGAPSLLLSRATDEQGHVQPTRAAWMAMYAPGQGYQFNAIAGWRAEA
ncbi:MAG: soxC, partial [Caulobacteraceae bacterium]|nr:soxC [Caulobacteraceae bacterium]